jgi:hypothetical protein
VSRDERHMRTPVCVSLEGVMVMGGVCGLPQP